MIIAIGNAPSSGSTFLADLLDSLPFAVCGPEINLFSVQSHFKHFDKIKRSGFFSSRTGIIYQGRVKLLSQRLCNYGIDKTLLHDILNGADTFQDFCKDLFKTFAILRGKKCSLFFEKTPQNIHCAKLFLDTFKNGIFLHIVRDPLYVYKSLLKRNFLPYIAAGSWLIDESPAYALRNHPRFITIFYEDLAENPYKTVCRFLKQVGIEFDAAELQVLYKNNLYRKTVSRKIKSWGINQYGVTGNANNQDIDPNDIYCLRYMLSTKISKDYARQFNIPEISFQKLIKYNGYHDCKNADGLKGILNINSLYDMSTAKKLFLKFLNDFLSGDAKCQSILAYMKPIELIGKNVWNSRYPQT